MATLAELQAWRDALFKARLSGTRSVSTDYGSVDYKSDSEMQAAIAAADAAIAELQGNRVKDIRISTSKGV